MRRSAIPCRHTGSARGFVGRGVLVLPGRPFAIGKGLSTYRTLGRGVKPENALTSPHSALIRRDGLQPECIAALLAIGEK